MRVPQILILLILDLAIRFIPYTESSYTLPFGFKPNTSTDLFLAKHHLKELHSFPTDDLTLAVIIGWKEQLTMKKFMDRNIQTGLIPSDPKLFLKEFTQSLEGSYKSNGPAIVLTEHAPQDRDFNTAMQDFENGLYKTTVDYLKKNQDDNVMAGGNVLGDEDILLKITRNLNDVPTWMRKHPTQITYSFPEFAIAPNPANTVSQLRLELVRDPNNRQPLGYKVGEGTGTLNAQLYLNVAKKLANKKNIDLARIIKTGIFQVHFIPDNTDRITRYLLGSGETPVMPKFLQLENANTELKILQKTIRAQQVQQATQALTSQQASQIKTLQARVDKLKVEDQQEEQDEYKKKIKCNLPNGRRRRSLGSCTFEPAKLGGENSKLRLVPAKQSLLETPAGERPASLPSALYRNHLLVGSQQGIEGLTNPSANDQGLLAAQFKELSSGNRLTPGVGDLNSALNNPNLLDTSIPSSSILARLPAPLSIGQLIQSSPKLSLPRQSQFSFGNDDNKFLSHGAPFVPGSQHNNPSAFKPIIPPVVPRFPPLILPKLPPKITHPKFLSSSKWIGAIPRG